MKAFVVMNIVFLLLVGTSFGGPQNSPPLTEYKLHAALKTANPNYTGKAKVYKDKDGKIWGVDLSGCKISSLEPLRGMDLAAVACGQNEIRDLSPLAGMKLKQFSCSQAPIADLSVLSGMPLWTIEITDTKVTDLTPLKGMSLQQIGFNPERVAKGMEVLRDMKSLIIILTGADPDAGKGTHVRVGLGAKEFWQKYDSGAFNKR